MALDPAVPENEHDLDIACAIVRIVQLYYERDHELLIERLAMCDVPRLLQYLSPRSREYLEQVMAEHHMQFPHVEERARPRRSIEEIFADAREESGNGD